MQDRLGQLKALLEGSGGKEGPGLTPKTPWGMLRDVQEGLSALTLQCHMHTLALSPLGDDFSECSSYPNC